jgi:hypothetical protein
LKIKGFIPRKELKMSSCQNQAPFSVSACGQAVGYLQSCIQKVGSNFDNLIQYITKGLPIITGTSYSIFSDPKVLQIFRPCMCGGDAQNHIQFLICYDLKCVKELKAEILTGSGLYWSGFCLIKEYDSFSIYKHFNNNFLHNHYRGTPSNVSKSQWSIPKPNEQALSLLPQVAPGKTNRVVLALELPYAVALETDTSVYHSKSWFTLAADVAIEVLNL